jgi:hypothetical protein
LRIGRLLRHGDARRQTKRQQCRRCTQNSPTQLPHSILPANEPVRKYTRTAVVCPGRRRAHRVDRGLDRSAPGLILLCLVQRFGGQPAFATAGATHAKRSRASCR